MSDALADAKERTPRTVFVQGAFLCLFLGSLAGTLGDRLYQMAYIAAVQDVFTDASSQIAFITMAGVDDTVFFFE